MTTLPSRCITASGTSGSLHGSSVHVQAIPGFNSSSPQTQSCLPVSTATTINSKRKRRPAGTPDPDAEVVALSPRALMESDKYVCEICGQGFQRDQNLQMHRRRHKVPWKLLKRPTREFRKCVYVCPDPTCLHNDPSHALGDLVGIKKHFRRKHSVVKQWKCEKCSKEYAVQSDYKAHLKICGSRGHLCDCGRVFSRVESFIEHQDNCNAAKDIANLGYCDSPSLASLTLRTTTSNVFIGRSSTCRALDSTGLNEQASLNVEQRELQFLPRKHQTSTSEATPGGFNDVGAVVLGDNIRTLVTKPRLNPAAPFGPRCYNNVYSTTEEDMSENAPGLELSIGLYPEYGKEAHGKRSTGR